MYTALDERYPAATVVVSPRADAVLSATADTEPTQRDGHIQAIAGKGRMAWQCDSGYHQRAGVEGQFARWKQVIGNGLWSTRNRHQRLFPRSRWIPSGIYLLSGKQALN